MKNGKYLRLIALLTAVLLCLTACGGNQALEKQEEPAEAKISAETVRFEQIWKYDEELEQDVEFAIITGLDAEGNQVWSHVTDRYPIGQDDWVEEVLYLDDQYIFSESGSLISLDIPTGDILWKNSEFEGYGVCGMEAPSGDLYFCGYLGTSFFAVDNGGKTLHKIESFGEMYDWAHDVRMEDGKIVITLGLGPEEYRTPDGFLVVVDPADYSFVPAE